MSTLNDNANSRQEPHNVIFITILRPPIGDSIPEANADKTSVRIRYSGLKYSPSMQFFGATEFSVMGNFPRYERSRHLQIDAICAI
jgi:hypothetical protein